MNRTRKMIRISNLFFWLSALAQTFPLLFYGIKAIVDGDVTTEQKVTVSLCFAAAAIFAIVNAVRKANLRSPLYIVMIGIYFALDDLLPLVFMMAAGCILDELVFTPLHKRYKELVRINKEIDRRG